MVNFSVSNIFRLLFFQINPLTIINSSLDVLDITPAFLLPISKMVLFFVAHLNPRNLTWISKNIGSKKVSHMKNSSHFLVSLFKMFGAFLSPCFGIHVIFSGDVYGCCLAFMLNFQVRVPSQSLTWNLNMDRRKKRFLLETTIFQVLHQLIRRIAHFGHGFS